MIIRVTALDSYKSKQLQIMRLKRNTNLKELY